MVAKKRGPKPESMRLTVESDGPYVRWKCSCGSEGKWLEANPGMPRVTAFNAWKRHLTAKHPNFTLEPQDVNEH